MLSHDGEDLAPETHAGCPGRGVFFRFYDPVSPVHYCANPDMYGHAFHVRIDRKRARPYDGQRRHRLGSLLAIGAKRGEEGSLTFNGDTTILTRPQQARKRHRQRAQPGTRPGRSDNQAVNR